MLRGVRLGLDVGSVRIGVAYSDPDGIMAMPITTITSGPAAIAQVSELVSEHRAVAVYVGNPINLAGNSTKSTDAAQLFASQLRNLLPAETAVRLVDERLSTVSAQRGLQAAGKSQKASRSVIDQAAAVIILEQALEIEKKSNDFAGVEVEMSNG